MEYRDFGKTGLRASILGFGGFHLLEIPLREASYLLNAYLDAGGNYIETAAGYGNGESERKIGRSVMNRRDEFVLVSKIEKRDKAGAAEQIDQTLKNLKTDRLDLLLMHGVASLAELDAVLSENGAIHAALEAQKSGKIRFIGISMHGWPGPLIEALHRWPFDAVMSTVNYYDRFNYPEIEEKLLPLARRKGAGVILMKPIADGYLYKSAPQAFRYAFSRPVSVVVTGINSRRMLEDDLRYAETYRPMTRREVDGLYKNAVELGNYVCRQCGKCSCPYGIDIPEVFACEGYYDRQMARGEAENTPEYALTERLRFWFGNQPLAKQRYARMKIRADACTQCGRCLKDCPYGIDIPHKLHLAHYKLSGGGIY